MANDYGVFQDGSNPVIWVVTANPLTTGSSDQAALYSEGGAMDVAVYLNSSNDNTFKVGRPGDRQPH